MNELPYRQNVQMIIINPGRNVLLILEKGEKETYWKFPQGGIEKGETAERTVARELKEEVTIHQFSILAKANYMHRYQWPAEMQKRKGFRGQEQQIFLILSTKPEEALPGEEKILKAKWMTFNEALKKFKIKDQKESAKIVWKEFEPIIKKHLKK